MSAPIEKKFVTLATLVWYDLVSQTFVARATREDVAELSADLRRTLEDVERVALDAYQRVWRRPYKKGECVSNATIDCIKQITDTWLMVRKTSLELGKGVDEPIAMFITRLATERNDAVTRAKKLRTIIDDVAKESGGATVGSTDDFVAHVPDEIKAMKARLTVQAERAECELEKLRADIAAKGNNAVTYSQAHAWQLVVDALPADALKGNGSGQENVVRYIKSLLKMKKNYNTLLKEARVWRKLFSGDLSMYVDQIASLARVIDNLSDEEDELK